MKKVKDKGLQSNLTPGRLRVIYEDNHLIAVYKPAGVLVQGDSSGDASLMDIVKQYIKRKYRKPGQVFLGLIHRLDRPVSGVVLFARTSKAASRLSEQWRNRQVGKIYWALVHGILRPERGTLKSYVKRNAKRVILEDEGGQGIVEAILSYRTISAKRDRSLVEIDLHTGRKHQIRVQLAAAGCPVEGDVKYGGEALGRQHEIRLAARSLTFVHPTRQEAMTIESPTPDWAKDFLPK